MVYKDITNKYNLFLLRDLSEMSIKAELLAIGLLENCDNCSECVDRFSKKCYFCGHKKIQSLDLQYLVFENLPKLIAVDLQESIEIIEEVCYYRGVIGSKYFLIFKNKLEIVLGSNKAEKNYKYSNFEEGYNIILGHFNE
jgi:hypothetical protein